LGAIEVALEKAGQVQTEGKHEGEAITRNIIRGVIQRWRDANDSVEIIPSGDGVISTQNHTGGVSLAGPIRRAGMDTQNERRKLYVQAEAVLERFTESEKMGREVLEAVKVLGGILKDMDQSEDGWQKLAVYLDQRGAGAGSEGGACPDPSAHDEVSLGPVVAKLSAWVEAHDGDVDEVLGG